MSITKTGTAQAEPPDALVGASLTLSQVVSLIEQMEYRQRALDAIRSDLMCAAVEMVTGGQRASENDLSFRSLRAELATTLSTSERVAEVQMDAAWSLRRNYEATYETLAAGEISAAHARVIVDAGLRVGSGSTPDVVARRAAYEAEVLQFARGESVNRLRPIARRIAEQFAVETLDERHQAEVRRRRVIVHERDDGMSDLLAYLPTAEAFAIHDRLTRIAREVERAEVRTPCESTRAGREAGETPATSSEAVASLSGADALSPDSEPRVRRSRDEIRADVLAELLLGSDPNALVSCSSAEALRVRVHVIVPLAALDRAPEHAATSAAGIGNLSSKAYVGDDANALLEVAELVGSGPVPLDTARSIAVAAQVWERVIVAPDSGSVIAVERYRPSEEMRRRLAARDQHCRFPGCRVPISRCDLDHTIDAALGGATSTENLAHLCRGHHVLKHHSDWRVRQCRDGDLQWTSPSGRRYLDQPPSRVRFARTDSEDGSVTVHAGDRGAGDRGAGDRGAGDRGAGDRGGRDRGGGRETGAPMIGTGRDRGRTSAVLDHRWHPF